MKRRGFLKVLKMALFGVVAVSVLGFLTMVLWNSLMPGIFSLRAISFWQALGLLLLSKILFGGFRPPTGGRGLWRRRMLERWERMTPEERENFRQGMRGRCGGGRERREDSEQTTGVPA